jgi:hypothetical protein
MRTALSIVVAAALLLPAAYAQPVTSQQWLSNRRQSYIEGENTTEPAYIPNTLPPPGLSQAAGWQPNSAQPGANGAEPEQSMEGCIVRRESGYYLEPGTVPALRLRGAQDLSSAANHLARVYGHAENGSSGATAGRAGKTEAAGGESAAAQDFQVARVQTLPESCPGIGSGASNPPPQP